MSVRTPVDAYTRLMVDGASFAAKGTIRLMCLAPALDSVAVVHELASRFFVTVSSIFPHIDRKGYGDSVINYLNSFRRYGDMHQVEKKPAAPAAPATPPAVPAAAGAPVAATAPAAAAEQASAPAAPQPIEYETVYKHSAQELVVRGVSSAALAAVAWIAADFLCGPVHPGYNFVLKGMGSPLRLATENPVQSFKDVYYPIVTTKFF